MQLYTQDCETFRTVVKMLVAKEPRLDELLHASLDKNLLEIQQRCLDDLRHFIKELDQVDGAVVDDVGWWVCEGLYGLGQNPQDAILTFCREGVKP